MSTVGQYRAVCWSIALVIGLAANGTHAAETPDFERDIAPLLVQHCLDCHQPNKLSGELNLATFLGLKTGGEQGPAIELGQPEKSLLLQRVTAGEMPPAEAKGSRPLSAVEVATLRAWIAAGASWPAGRELGVHEKTVNLDEARQFWSFQRVRRTAIPHVAHAERVANPIDTFIWQQLEAQQLTLSPRAVPSDLLRRLTLDLHGLPPTLDEVDEFVSQVPPSPSRLVSQSGKQDEETRRQGDSEKSYQSLVDKLLASPHYGERWARHWLDLVRYADSNGYERDAAKPSVWRYRDYVINALNADKPYDRFVIEQLAGDELPEASFETMVATGYHALGTWQDEVDPLEAAQYRADELDDMIRTTAQTFLGVTLGCARCHQHKFDPLTMVDYYSLSAILAPLKRPNQGRTDRDLPTGTREQLVAVARRDESLARLERQVVTLVEPHIEAWLASGKSKLPADVQEAWLVPTGKRTSSQQQLAQKHRVALFVEVEAALTSDIRQQVLDLRGEQQQLQITTPDLPRTYRPFEDSPAASPTHLLLSGRASNPGPAMQPRVPAVLASLQPVFPAPAEHSTLRRLTFARWVASPDNPLTARVIVNRVWQHHFGTGLVATSSDFGHIGARPTHPELLDWLAHWFMHDAGWSLKKLHKLIVTSETYRQSSIADLPSGRISNPQSEIRNPQLVDPENRLFWRYPYRRLDVEAIRDSTLAVSGALNSKMFGPAVYLPVPEAVIEAHTDKEAAWRVSPAPDIDRRTVYAFVKRTLLVPMLETFDFCDTTQSTDRRAITSIATQALTLYNGEFVNRQAERFARRLEHEASVDPARRIELAYRLALARMPTVEEMTVMRRFLASESDSLREDAKGSAKLDAGTIEHRALVQLCRAILNLNEFVYPN